MCLLNYPCMVSTLGNAIAHATKYDRGYIQTSTAELHMFHTYPLFYISFANEWYLFYLIYYFE
ncbi:hypothetical protein D3C81_1845520 [compost metagenome]